MDSDLAGILDLVKSDRAMTQRIQELVAEGRTPSQAANLAMAGQLSKAEEDREGAGSTKLTKALDVLHGRATPLIEKGTTAAADALRLVHAARAPKAFKVGSVTYTDRGPFDATNVEDPRRFGRSPLE